MSRVCVRRRVGCPRRTIRQHPTDPFPPAPTTSASPWSCCHSHDESASLMFSTRPMRVQTPGQVGSGDALGVQLRRAAMRSAKGAALARGDVEVEPRLDELELGDDPLVLALEKVDADVVQRAPEASGQPVVGRERHRRRSRPGRPAPAGAPPPNCSLHAHLVADGQLVDLGDHAAGEHEDRHLAAGAHRLHERLRDPGATDRGVRRVAAQRLAQTLSRGSVTMIRPAPPAPTRGLMTAVPNSATAAANRA